MFVVTSTVDRLQNIQNIAYAVSVTLGLAVKTLWDKIEKDAITPWDPPTMTLSPPFIVLALWYISWCIKLNLVQDTSTIASLLTGSCSVFNGIVHRNVLWRPLWFMESCKFVYMVDWFCFLCIHLFIFGWLVLFCWDRVSLSSTWPHIWFSCLSLLSARMIGRGHNTWLPLSIWAFALFHCSWLLRDSL